MTVILAAATLTLGALTSVDRVPRDLRPGPTWFLTPPYLIVLAATGALIASRRPRNSIGWLLCAAAVMGALMGLGHLYSQYGLATGHPGLVGLGWLAWLADWIWLPWLMLQIVYLPVLFPDGRLPSKRWIWFIGASALTALVGVSGQALDPELLATLKLPNPVGVPAVHGYLHVATDGAIIMLFLLALASLASVFVRLRGATGDRKRQLKWFGSAITLVTVVAAGMITDALLDGISWPWWDVLINLAYLTIPLSVGFSVLRYRLYGIDLVMNRTLMYGALATLISAVYLIMVAGVGALVGLGNRLDLMLSLLATGALALAFQPVREHVLRLANRLVYRRRATPYDALAVLSGRVAETGSTELLFKDMVRTTCDAIGVPSASFWLRESHKLSLVASWPPDSKPQAPHLSPPDRVSDISGVRALPVQHQGNVLGAISVAVPPGRSLSVSDEKLLTEMANQAGLVFRNLDLTSDLMARVRELRESRRRLVTAQDEERRRLERNLHDGAQQHLFGLKVNIRHVRTLLEQDVSEAKAALERLEDEAEEALQTIRELARGVYPPLLTAQGLAGALSARARAAPIDVRISTDGTGRYAAHVEEAVYFCCTEALQNAVRHARAGTVRIRLAQEGDELTFTVEDDGRGFDVTCRSEGGGLQSMNDRIDVVGGALEIVSKGPQGTRVRGRVPVDQTNNTRPGCGEATVVNLRLSHPFA